MKKLIMLISMLGMSIGINAYAESDLDQCTTRVKSFIYQADILVTEGRICMSQIHKYGQGQPFAECNRTKQHIEDLFKGETDDVCPTEAVLKQAVHSLPFKDNVQWGKDNDKLIEMHSIIVEYTKIGYIGR